MIAGSIPGLLAFLALLFSLLLLGHFHLLSQVVTHTQILRHPPEPDRRLSRIRLSSWWLVSTGDWPTHPLYGIRFVQWLSPLTGATNRHSPKPSRPALALLIHQTESGGHLS